MVEKKLEAVQTVSENVSQAQARAEVDVQIAELRAEIARLTEAVSAIGSGTRAVVQGEAELMVERVRERVREEPLSTLVAVAGVSFLFGLISRR
ncbi:MULTISPECIES: hypothetical protein [Sinorhizobium/Ensifer group]|jgi:ElaB/YqjD/DUF883 family membrane-anchored ribosome-binding protein|uniref:hypothetical protein n=1 Tax=Sinorhizobium/Ensifer group TaxID=227292 RepID=UPI000710B9FD|nr:MULTISPECIES: hypothetical protein [Sinorhizobium/Ensifer group]KRD64121.1 hypothetical protein ASE60_03090 [Ensifer sp. Root278]KSV85246.1 hypothetical protein N183_02060 [Sinorhizobium sp. Sb3]KSV95638.1 hypothetical protein N184_01435 [Sinorhizobium sp. GL28]MBD9506137.1 hypothetical protein [Ensifer sp. ENS10]MBV7516025.1 hypothetical protein [Ensifer sp. ENS12]